MIFHPSFPDLIPEEVLAESMPPAKDKPLDALPGMSPYIQALYRIPLLGDEQEIYLFRRMNYLEYLAKPNYLLEAKKIRDLIIKSNLRLVVYHALNFVNARHNRDDWISDGNLVLFNAVKLFDYSKGYKFSTYASLAIINTFRKRHKADRKYASRFRPGVGDRVIDEREENPLVEACEEANKKLNLLEGEELELILTYYGFKERKNMPKIAKEQGCSKEWIRQKIQKALVKMGKL
jgi:RNA polymerase sigma factor (sigma-70 family)